LTTLSALVSRPPVQVRRDDLKRQDGAEPDDAAELVGRFRDEVPDTSAAGDRRWFR
jgi:hypothetical protein